MAQISSNYSISFMNSFSPTSIVKCISDGIRTIINKSGFFQELSSTDLRIDFDIDGNCLGLLCEPASENRFSNNSQNPASDGWSHDGVYIGGSNGPCGNGGSSTYFFNPGNSMDSYSVNISSGYWTVSFYACGEGDFTMNFIDDSNNFSLTNGYKRYSITSFNPSVSNRSLNVTFDTETTIKICAVQIEPLPFASSYIPTLDGVSNRERDIYYIDYVDDGYEFNIIRYSAKSTVNFKYISPNDPQYIMILHDTDENGFFSMYLDGPNNQMVFEVNNSPYPSSFDIDINTDYNVCLTSDNYNNQNIQKLYVDKVVGESEGLEELDTDTQMGRLYIGCSNESYQLCGYVKDISISSKIITFV